MVKLLKPQYRDYHGKVEDIPMSAYVEDRIRNFSIVAHVDHGKSTLADRLLEFTGTIHKHSLNKQVLDKLQVERERGITVKAQTSSMFFTSTDGTEYLYNLIDTPGHVDFGYEVSRSLRACQGVLLVVDASQGVQAQTVANHNLAWDSDLFVVPVVNKIDLQVANVDKVCAQIERIFGYDNNEIMRVSAKKGIGIEQLMQSIHDNIPPPEYSVKKPLSLFLFDSWHDHFRGVICLMAVQNGILRKGDIVESAHLKEKFQVSEIGIMHPEETPVDMLCAGQVGFVSMKMKDVKKALVGDTFYHIDKPVKVVEGFKAPTPMVFAGVYPPDQGSLDALRVAIQKLRLNDAALEVHRDSSSALGQGFRIGFLGLLHLEIFKERLQQEHDMEILVTNPNVPYKVKLDHKDKLIEIHGADDYPDSGMVECIYEPRIIGTIMFPDEFLKDVVELCQAIRGEQIDCFIDDGNVILKYNLPLNEVMVDFNNKLKSLSRGYATFDYDDAGFAEADIVKMDILLNGEVADAMSVIVHRSKVKELGISYTTKLRDSIPRDQFEIVIQAAVGKKVFCREVIKPYRKDLFQKWGGDGGDQTRKRKLLDIQKAGKKKLKSFGKVKVPHDSFLSLFKR